MANGTRTLTLLIVLVIGLAVGWWIGHANPAPPQNVTTLTPTTRSPQPLRNIAAGDHLISVGPNEELGPVISMSHGHQIEWKARKVPNGAATLQIVFRNGDFDKSANSLQPFAGNLSNGDLIISCAVNGRCKSTPINDKLPSLATGADYYYKYLQIFLDKNGNPINSEDAGIIIEK